MTEPEANQKQFRVAKPQIPNKMKLIKPQRNWMADLHQRKIPTDTCI